MHSCEVAPAKHFADSVVSLHINHYHDELHGVDPLVDNLPFCVVELKDVAHGDQKEPVRHLPKVIFEADASQSRVDDVQLLGNLFLLGVQHHDCVLLLIQLKEFGLGFWLSVLRAAQAQKSEITYSLFSSSSSIRGY